ncbi:hypothetical protein NUW58_g4426 [Xylaria curta]|uniref:Uncharacterized protein n=1 Tax=Xylaria curta TaxID=42375 RepID=A0ACC1P7X3_9PEZI|nr:hypothetical protein NUW58_g4426 [Xylaria curta]
MRSILFVSALAATAAAHPLAKAQSAITCVSGLYMIAARGSEEAPGEGHLSQITILVKALVPGSTSVAVDYPAAIYDDGTYPVSVSKGITDTIKKIKDYVAACGSSSRIALLGFSQGGNVMTDVLAGGVLKPAPIGEDYRRYIRSVVSLGDPTFTTGQSFDVGNATRNGIFSRGGDSLAKLNTYAGVLQSYSEVPTFASAAAQFIASKA